MIKQSNKTFLIKLKNEIFHIPKYFRRIGEVSEKIYTELTEKGIYQVQSLVQSTTLHSFLEYWQNEKLPDVDSTNFWEFYLLSQEFGMMNDYLQSSKFSQISKILFIRNLASDSINNHTDRSNSEQQIAENLDYYITNFQEELFSLPATSLYNIFKHKSRHLTKSNEAYEAIIKRPQLSFLIDTINASDLSEASITDAFVHKDERFGFTPFITSEFIEKRKNISEKKETHSKTIKTKKWDFLFIIDVENLKSNDIRLAIDQISDISFDIAIKHRATSFKFALILYEKSEELTKIFDFDFDIDNLATFAEDAVKSLNDEIKKEFPISCNYANILDNALKLSWRNGRKSIYWIAGGPSKIDFSEQVIRMALEGYRFITIDYNDNAEEEFMKMKQIYQDALENSFRIDIFSSENKVEIHPDFVDQEFRYAYGHPDFNCPYVSYGPEFKPNKV